MDNIFRKMRSSLVFVILFAAFQDLQCLQSTPQPRLNFFDIDLLRHTAESKPGNVVLSPASIKATLAMLLEGAAGRTASEIKSTLRLSHARQEFREELKAYLRALNANVTGSVLKSANAIFVSKDLKVRKDYEALMKNVYSTEVQRLNFREPGPSTKIINDWVNSETRGLIPAIIEEAHISPSSEVLVANVLYFKSAWVHGFDPKLTHGDCFYKDTVCRTVAMMELQAELKYTYMDDLRSHIVELPYQGNRYSLILLVPEDREAGIALIRDLPYVGLPAIYELMQPTDVYLTMPKFTIDYSEDLVDSLRSSGIRTLFSTNANLSGIFEDSSPAVTTIHQTVHLSVDEEGTVAAAATAGLIVPLIGDHVELRIDRPFIFFIRDNEYGLMLFEGKVEEPTAFVGPEVVKVQTSSTTERSGNKPTSTNVPTPQKPVTDRTQPHKTTARPFVNPTPMDFKAPGAPSVENRGPNNVEKAPEQDLGSKVTVPLTPVADNDVKQNKESNYSAVEYDGLEKPKKDSEPIKENTTTKSPKFFNDFVNIFRQYG